jgi:hypothetical protein
LIHNAYQLLALTVKRPISRIRQERNMSDKAKPGVKNSLEERRDREAAVSAAALKMIQDEALARETKTIRLRELRLQKEAEDHKPLKTATVSK